jgi:hypothetical protein
MRRGPLCIALLATAAALLAAPAAAGTCTHLRDCNGHGTCDTANSKCKCYNGWGSASDVALYKAPDCPRQPALAHLLPRCRMFKQSTDLRHSLPIVLHAAGTCPADNAWVDVPTGPNTAHAVAECSNAGLCDRATGRCRCFAGFEGEACQRCEWSEEARWHAGFA